MTTEHQSDEARDWLCASVDGRMYELQMQQIMAEEHAVFAMALSRLFFVTAIVALVLAVLQVSEASEPEVIALISVSLCAGFGKMRRREEAKARDFEATMARLRREGRQFNVLI